jgi:hypothetical protein
MGFYWGKKKQDKFEIKIIKNDFTIIINVYKLDFVDIFSGLMGIR